MFEGSFPPGLLKPGDNEASTGSERDEVIRGELLRLARYADYASLSESQHGALVCEWMPETLRDKQHTSTARRARVVIHPRPQSLNFHLNS